MIPFTGYEVAGGVALIALLATLIPDIFENKVFFKDSSHRRDGR